MNIRLIPYVFRGMVSILFLMSTAACSEFSGNINNCPIVFQTSNWFTAEEGSYEYYPTVDRTDNRCPISIVQPGEQVFSSGFVWGNIADVTLPTQRAELSITNAANVVVAEDEFAFFSDIYRSNRGGSWPWLSGCQRTRHFY